MNVSTTSTSYTRHIPTRMIKGDSYLYAQSYYEAGDFGLMAIDPTTLNILATYSLRSSRISDFHVYSDSRIVVRSTNNLVVLSFDGSNFSEVCSKSVVSSINVGVTCNNDFAYISCGSKIISVDISADKIAQEYNVPDYFYVRDITCTDDYLFARKTNLNFTSFKLTAYEINNDYATNPHNNIYRLDEVSTAAFDMDLGRLTVDSSLNIIETGLEANRFLTFNGSTFTIVGNLTPFYPALEFIKHGNYYFISPGNDLIIFSLSGLTLTEEYNSPLLTRRPSYICPGFSIFEFFSSRDALGDGTGRNISKREIVA